MKQGVTVNFALMGCGRIAQRYAALLAGGEVSGGRLVAVCDPQGDRAELLAQKVGLPFFKDLNAMMSGYGGLIDVVCVLTESGHHARDVLNVVQKYVKHVVVEKPMALTLSDADQMIAQCDQKGVKLFVVKQNRLNLPVQKLREAFSEGRFGKLVMGSVKVRWHRDQSYYDQDDWRGTWALDGGVFANQASHHIDLLEWFFGEPVSVFAKSSTSLVDIEVEDTGAAIIKFKSGAICVVEATTAARPNDIEGSLTILGEKGNVEIGGFAVNKILRWEFSEPMKEDDEILRNFSENPPDVYGFGHKAYLENVVKAISLGGASLVDGLEGRKSLELISAIYESIETGREIALRFSPSKCKLGVLRSDSSL
ncbi:Gfo/Idh/MocA family protein [Kiloniella laminariae]|uniref:Gfo/Idh/MocA family protein n=1 Tax=Kiloniella laminariae TaxID=454162 RepID=UPI00036ABE67|nr:Gfo/Idh/MocA family oxidoreductase [Kiloniella laminariae]